MYSVPVRITSYVKMQFIIVIFPTVSGKYIHASRGELLVKYRLSSITVEFSPL